VIELNKIIINDKLSLCVTQIRIQTLNL